MHLDLDLSVALARLATSAADVEGETARFVAAHLRLGRERVELADVREEVCVRRRVRARRAADRLLVDLDHLVEDVDPLHAAVQTRLDARSVESVRKRLEDDLVHERRLAGARDARDADELAHGKLYVDLLEGVLCGAADEERPAILLTPLGHRDRALAGKELTRHRLPHPLYLRRRPFRHDLAAVQPGD